MRIGVWREKGWGGVVGLQPCLEEVLRREIQGLKV
jgi:hypothetical protein